jgi:DNA modification methylase
METLASFPDNCIDLICTDPPYKVISGGKNTKHKAGWKVSVLKENDGKIFKHNSIKAVEWMGELFRVLKPGREAYIMVNNECLLEYLTVAKQVGFKFHNLLRWDKNTKNANRWYMKDCEYTLFFYKPPARTINNPGSSQGFFAKNPRNKANTHPTEKPVKLFQHYIENSTEPDWIVLDPFMGYGAAAIACLRTSRQFVGVELDEVYYERTTKRVARYQKRNRARVT